MLVEWSGSELLISLYEYLRSAGLDVGYDTMWNNSLIVNYCTGSRRTKYDLAINGAQVTVVKRLHHTIAGGFKSVRLETIDLAEPGSLERLVEAISKH